MPRYLRRSLPAFAAGVALVLFLTARYPSAAVFDVRTEAELAALGRGFYPLEANGNLRFAWTGPHAELTIPALDRRAEWALTADLRMWRPPDALPHVRIVVDGTPVLDETLKSHRRVVIP